MTIDEEVRLAVRDARADEILNDAKKPVAWLVEDLIEDDRDKGHQWVITGEPKNGKSRLAMQLAVSMSRGSDFIGFNTPKRKKILYFNFEMSKRVAATRVVEFFGGESTFLEAADNFYVVSNYSRVDVLDPVRCEVLQRIVEAVNPDVVFWDVLRRMSSADENNNGEMSDVMQAIRRVSARRTHFVVHHSKKGLYDHNQGARGLRGASAIHAECDGVISIAKVRGRHTLAFDARSVPGMDIISLNSEGISFARSTEPLQDSKSKVADKDEFVMSLSSEWTPRKTVSFQVKAGCEVKGVTVDRYLNEWVASGILEKKKEGRETFYRLINQSSSSR